MLDWLRLIRASGLLTIASNVLAAVLVAATGDDLTLRPLIKRLHSGGAQHLLWIPLASFCLYAAGMLWNDLTDVDRDRVLNPRRPLPSGRIGIATAYVAGVVLALGALICGYLAEGRTGFNAAGVVLTLALLYNFVAKDVPYVGSLVMGLVRASHAIFALLLLGQDYFKMALPITREPDHQPLLFAYPLILGIYIFGLTLVSELESRRAHRWELLLGGACIACAIAVAVARIGDAHWLKPLWHRPGIGPVGVGLALASALIVLVSLLTLIGRPYLEALRTGKQALVGSTVFAGLAGIILLDALVAVSAHPLGAVLVAAAFPLFRGIGAMIRMD